MSDLPVVIVGGGITGLSAAWFLQQQGIAYHVLEGASRWGGKVRTEVIDDPEHGRFVVEAGPDAFLARKPQAIQLANALGLESELIETNPVRHRTQVLSGGKLIPLPEGLQMIVPTRWLPLLRSPLLTVRGKIRTALEPLIPLRPGNDDESLADFVRRRLGEEVLDKLAEPLMSGIYSTDPNTQSLLATFPRFRQLEQVHGSLIRGLHASDVGQNAPSSAFLSFTQGMGMLVEQLVASLDSGLRLNTCVLEISKKGRNYLLRLNDGSVLEASQVILTTPAPVTARLIAPFASAAAAQIGEIEHVTTGTISFAFHADAVTLPDSYGVVIPRSEGRAINAITITSNKFAHRAPAGYVLLRAYFGGARSPQTLRLDDEALTAVVRAELKRIYGITAEPVFVRIYRWQEGNPQYNVGHLDHIAQIEGQLPAGLMVTGCAFRGVGIPDCIDQAAQTVRQLSQLNRN